MKITTQLTIDLAKRQILEKVDAVQCDANTRAVVVTLTASGLPWVPGDGLTASVACQKPDRASAWYDTLPDGTAACSVSENVVTAILAPEVLTAAGQVKAAIVFQNDRLDQLATFPFIIAVEENPAAGNKLSNNYYNLQTLGQINDAISTLDQTVKDFAVSVGAALQGMIDDTSVGGKAWSSRKIVESLKTTAILCTAEGESISVSDAAAYPLQALTVYGKSVQNGMPTPDAPVPIVNAGAESGGINVYTLNGIADAKPVITKISYPVTVVYGEYINYSVIAVGNNPSYQWQYRRNPDSTEWLDYSSSTQGANEATLTVLAAELRVNRPTRCVITDAGGNSTISDEMISILGEETVYTERIYFDMPQISIPTPNGLPGLPVSSGGNYTDANGQMYAANCRNYHTGKEDQRVAKIVFDGSDDEVWKYDTNYNYAYIALDNARYGDNDDVLVVSTHARGVSYNQRNQTTSVCHMTSTAPTMYFRYMGCQSKDEWIQFLKENPVTVLYVMAEPVEQDIPEAERVDLSDLHTYKPNTTIVNDAGAGMAVEYVADPKTYIDNKFAELATAMAAN